MSENLVVIPTYNEVENIEDVIRAVFSLEKSFHILVVDDNSPDGTANRVKSLKSEFKEELFLEMRGQKYGLGRAYIHGFKWALNRNYQYIYEMDADFSHNPKDLVRLYNACIQDKVDVVVGSRYIKGINVIDWPLSRILLSYGASLYVRMVTGMKIKDPTAGFICYRREVLETIDFDNVSFIGYAFQIEMKYKTTLRGFVVKEISTIFKDRAKGKSKMSKHIIKEAIIGVILMKIRGLRQKYVK